MKTKFYAVLHVTAREFTKLANLGNRVISKLTEFVGDYATPDPSVAALTTEVGKLVVLNGQAKGSTLKKDERDAQAQVVYDMLVQERDYVNSIAKGDKVKVDKSGFDADKEPEAVGTPPAPVIKKVVDGEAAHSAKISLVGPLFKNARYSVQLAQVGSGNNPNPTPPDTGEGDFDPDHLPWEMQLESVNSYELILLNLKRGKDIAIRVRAEHGSKKSNWSDLYLFLPR
jgi:hypothetical protein